MSIQLFTDGSCPRNPGPGGWAFVVIGMDAKPICRSGASRDTTNNRMEMLAVIRGLEFLIREDTFWPIEIVSDSQYVIRGLSEWCKKWKANDWHRKDEKGRWVPISNPDLWKLLHGLAHVTLRDLCSFTWQRGHVGHEYNELCDKMAGEAAWRLIEGV